MEFSSAIKLLKFELCFCVLVFSNTLCTQELIGFECVEENVTFDYDGTGQYTWGGVAHCTDAWEPITDTEFLSGALTLATCDNLVDFICPSDFEYDDNFLVVSNSQMSPVYSIRGLRKLPIGSLSLQFALCSYNAASPKGITVDLDGRGSSLLRFEFKEANSSIPGISISENFSSNFQVDQEVKNTLAGDIFSIHSFELDLKCDRTYDAFLDGTFLTSGSLDTFEFPYQIWLALVEFETPALGYQGFHQTDGFAIFDNVYFEPAPREIIEEVSYFNPNLPFPEQIPDDVDSEGNFSIMIPSGYNCTDTLRVWNALNEEDCLGPIMNAFTPNNDNINDRFRLIPFSEFEEFCSIESSQMSIYNRFGEEIFTSLDAVNSGWNGKDAQGINQESGSYLATFQVKFVDYPAPVSVTSPAYLIR